MLHSARYRRKPRGGPVEVESELAVRQSFCCARDGGRRRLTPPSLLFLGRKVFFGVVVLLVPILREGLTPARFRRLTAELPVSRRSVQRWRQWWHVVVPATPLWEAERGQLARPLEAEGRLPATVLAAFSAMAEGSERVLAVLSWLAGESGSATAGGRAG